MQVRVHLRFLGYHLLLPQTLAPHEFRAVNIYRSEQCEAT